jgi:hypothetical protein
LIDVRRKWDALFSCSGFSSRSREAPLVRQTTARPDGANARAGVQAAIARLPRKGGAVLHFPPGFYRFGSERDPGIHVVDVDGLTINAPGCTFVFQDVAFPVGLERCRSARLHGFAIDWERPPF